MIFIDRFWVGVGVATEWTRVTGKEKWTEPSQTGYNWFKQKQTLKLLDVNC